MLKLTAMLPITPLDSDSRFSWCQAAAAHGDYHAVAPFAWTTMFTWPFGSPVFVLDTWHCTEANAQVHRAT